MMPSPTPIRRAVRRYWGDAFADAVAPVLTDLRTDALALL
jgi:hypothetical protein